MNSLMTYLMMQLLLISMKQRQKEESLKKTSIIITLMNQIMKTSFMQRLLIIFIKYYTIIYQNQVMNMYHFVMLKIKQSVYISIDLNINMICFK